MKPSKSVPTPTRWWEPGGLGDRIDVPAEDLERLLEGAGLPAPEPVEELMLSEDHAYDASALGDPPEHRRRESVALPAEPETRCERRARGRPRGESSSSSRSSVSVKACS